MQSYLSRSWIHPNLVRGESRIHGEGVIASAFIPCGERLMVFGGDKITGAVAAGGLYRERSVWFVADDIYLALPVSDPEPSLDENLNHSCNANAWLTDEVTLAARRDIAAGEEITLDQGTWNFNAGEYTWDQAPCGCGAVDCRVTLTEQDWTLATVQERYRGHLHPAVQKLIDLAKI